MKTVVRRLKPARYAVYAVLPLAVACIWPSPERQLLLDFFQACRVYDRTTLARLATVSCNPQTDGVVQRIHMLAVDRGEGVRRATIRTLVQLGGGRSSEQDLDVTIERRDGRWMVTAVKPLQASQTLPAASSDRP